MANSVPTPIKRAHLRSAIRAAVAASATLISKLEANEATQLSSSGAASGNLVANVSRSNGAGSQSTGFSNPSKENFDGVTPISLISMWDELITLHAAILEENSDLDGDDEGDAQAIGDAMLVALVACTEYSSDFSQLRTGREAAA